MRVRPDWAAAVEADARFPLVEAAAGRAGLRWSEWWQQLCRDGFDDVDIRALPEDQAALPAHAHPYDLRVLVLSGSVTLSLAGGALHRAHGDCFELAAHTVHAESFGADGYTYLAARRHAVPGPTPARLPPRPNTNRPA